MSTIRRYTIQVLKPIVISTISQSDLTTASQQLQTMFLEKWKRIEPFIPACDCAILDGNLFLYDELGITKEIPSFLDQFGMECEEIPISSISMNKGKLYQVTDSTLELLKHISPSSEQVTENLNLQIHSAESLKSKMKTSLADEKISIRYHKEFEQFHSTPEIQVILSTLLKGNTVEIQETHQQTRLGTPAGSILNSKIVQSDRQKYVQANNIIKDTLNQVLSSHQRNIISGTVASIERRAKSLGYAVSRNQGSSKIELTLYRGE